MNRRNFVKRSLAGLSGACAGFDLEGWAKVPDALAGTPTGQKLKVQYVRESIPEFQVPPYRGQSYQDTVPDTLDLAERSRLAVHAMTSITDPLADDEVFWVVDFARNPPVMTHDFNDWVLQLEGMLEGLPLARLASGSTENASVDPTWMTVVLKSLGPDGLAYIPLEGRPWGRKSILFPNQRAFKPDGSSAPLEDASVTQIGSAYTCQRVMPAMTVYYLRDQNPMWKAAIEKMIQRLSQLSMSRGDYCYYPDGVLVPNGSYGSHNQMPTGIACIEWGGNGRLIQALAQYYSVSHYEPARDLAAKLTRYIRLEIQYFKPDGTWLISDTEKGWLEKNFDLRTVKEGGHSHAHTIGLLSVLDYGLACDDREAVEFARGGYQWGKAHGTPLVGFFPEFYVPGYRNCETDTISDMLGLAVKLSAAGVADYWDDVDRWVRNQFVEQQLTSIDWVYRLAERSPRKPVAPNETGDHVPERNVGAFAGWAAPNDWTHRVLGYEAAIMHCCMGNGARALYYVWEHILDNKDGRLRVNLLLNRASAWADVYSHIPYEGKVELKVKSPCREVLVRVPEWIETRSPQVAATLNGRTQTLSWQGRYVNAGPAKPGDKLVVAFPVPRKTLKQEIATGRYTLDVKGNTVVGIDPPGENGPLYKREYYIAERAPTRKVERFVADAPILW